MSSFAGVSVPPRSEVLEVISVVELDSAIPFAILISLMNKKKAVNLQAYLKG
jgi:hypothetical protein